MALLFYDGFDHYGTSQLDQFGKWAIGSSGSSFPQTTVARTGAYSLKCFGNNYPVFTKPYATSGGVVVGFAFYMGGGSSPAIDTLLEVRETGGLVHLAMGMSVDFKLTVRLGASVLATGTTVLSPLSWYHIALKADIHDTLGNYEVQIDGVTEAALTSTLVDTRNGGTGVWSHLRLNSPQNAFVHFDDFYLCDTSGPAPWNTFLGAVRVETLFPQTDAVAAGSNAGLTPSTGTDHGAMVDEPIPNTTDFNGSATVGAKDTYNYPPMTLTGVIYGVQTNLYINKADSSPRQACSVVRVGSTDYDGPARSLPTTFQYVCTIHNQNPATSALWTPTDIASLQVGMKVVA